MITLAYETAIIFKREFIARRDVLLLGAATAFLVLVFPFLPGLANQDHGDLRGAAAFVLALVIGIILSIGLGVTVLGSDLSERRLGFYFERSVPTQAIWMGKFAASYSLVVLSQFVIILTSGFWMNASPLLELSVVDLLRGLDLFDEPVWYPWFVVAPLYLLLTSHCVGVMLRARTAWLVVDFVGVAIAAVAGWFAFYPLFNSQFGVASAVVGFGIAGCVLAALVIATAIGLAQGRTDLHRTHQYLSISMWGVLTVCLGMILAYSAWLRDFGPGEFTSVHVRYASPDGQWLEVLGGADGHLDVRRQFLVSIVDERYIPLPTPMNTWGGWSSIARVSTDGSRAVWLTEFGEDAEAVWYANLHSNILEPVATTITVPKGTYDVRVSPGGHTITCVNERTLSMFDLESEALLTTARIPGEEGPFLYTYTAPENVRVLSVAYSDRDGERDRSLTYSDLAVEQHSKLVSRNSFMVPGGQGIKIDFGLKYIVFGYHRGDYSNWVPSHPPQRVYSSSSGELVKEIDGSIGGFLSADRIWSVQRSENGQVDLVFESLIDDTEYQEFALEAPRGWFFVGSGPAGEVFYGHDTGYSSQWSAWSSVEVFDIVTGERRLIGEEIEIDGLRERHYSFGDYVDATAFEGDLLTLLARSKNGSYFVWNPVSEQLEPVIKRQQ